MRAGCEAGLLALMASEEVAGEFVLTAVEVGQLTPIDHARQRGASGAGLDVELAGEGDQQPAGKPRRDGAEQGRRDDAAGRELAHVSG